MEKSNPTDLKPIDESHSDEMIQLVQQAGELSIQEPKNTDFPDIGKLSLQEDPKKKENHSEPTEPVAKPIEELKTSDISTPNEQLALDDDSDRTQTPNEERVFGFVDQKKVNKIPIKTKTSVGLQKCSVGDQKLIEPPCEESKTSENFPSSNEQLHFVDDSMMARALKEKRGVSLFSDAQAEEVKQKLAHGKTLVVIISDVPIESIQKYIPWKLKNKVRVVKTPESLEENPHAKRCDDLAETIKQYTKMEKKKEGRMINVGPFEVVIACPEVSRATYNCYHQLPEVTGAFTVIGYEIQEVKAEKRWRNVGDTRNAALLCGLYLKANYFFMSDDDRHTVFKYGENEQQINISDSIEILQEFHDTIHERIKNIELLGIGSQTNHRSQSSTDSPWVPESIEEVPFYDKNGKKKKKKEESHVRVAQLVVINLEKLKQYDLSYLPVRMGEDNTFCYDVSRLEDNKSDKKVCEMRDWQHTCDNKLISLARNEDNANIDTYTVHEYPYLEDMFSKIITRDGLTNKNMYYLYWRRHLPKKISMGNQTEEKYWGKLVRLRDGYLQKSAQNIIPL